MLLPVYSFLTYFFTMSFIIYREYLVFVKSDLQHLYDVTCSLMMIMLTSLLLFLAEHM